MRCDSGRFLQRFSQDPVGDDVFPCGYRLPTPDVRSGSRSRSFLPPPVHVWVVGLSHWPTSWFVVSDGHLVDSRAGARLGVFRFRSTASPVAASPVFWPDLPDVSPDRSGSRPSSPGTSRPSSGPSSGSLRVRSVRLRASPLAFPRASRVLRFGRSMPSSCADRPRGFYHLDGVFELRPPACLQLAPDLGFAGLILRRSLVLHTLRWVHLGSCAGGSRAPGPSKGCSSSVAGSASPQPLPSCRSSLSPIALAPGFGFFRTDRSPRAARVRSTPSFAAFLLRPAEDPGGFPLRGVAG